MMDLNKVKEYLQVDYEDEDDYIKDLIVVSEIYIDGCAGENYKNNEKDMKLANILQLKLINDMYEMRGTTISNNCKKDIMVTTILDKLSNS